jgi:hypothetical protein
MFYNSINLKGADLKTHSGRAFTQSQKILAFFIRNREQAFTPAEVYRAMDGFLLTSVRRSMSDLTKSGDLIKTDSQALGQFGSANYKWMLNEVKHPKQLKLF